MPAASTYVAARAAAGAHARLRTWGSAAERARVRADLERAAEWARDRGRPLFLGEFGTIAHARMADRAAWTRVVRTEAERLGLPWAYWDHDTDFGASDRAHGAWHAPILHTLLGGG